jgi:hypothetical protein
MRTRIFLNPSNNVLVGAYPPGVEHVHVVLDSANAAFSVQLPDVTMPEHKEFIFYNYPSDGVGHDVTLLPVTGQLMINTDTSHVLQPGDTVSACADLRNRWLLTDVNKTDPSVIDHALLDNLNSSSYTHLTAANHTDLTDGGVTALHSHAADHAAATIADTSTIDMSISGQQISGVTIGLTDTITFVE